MIRKVRMYFHVIEDGGYNNVAWRGYYLTESEAQAEVNRLKDLFPRIDFYVFVDTSTREPNFITI